MNIISPMAGRVEYDTGRVVINLSFFFFPWGFFKGRRRESANKWVIWADTELSDVSGT